PSQRTSIHLLCYSYSQYISSSGTYPKVYFPLGTHPSWRNYSKNWKWKVVFGGMIVLLVSSFVTQRILLRISEKNYPGGYALFKLNEFGEDYPTARVHIDTKSAMTGVSRFGETNPLWEYSKDEHLSIEDLQRFDFILSENETVKGFIPIGKE